ncbi:MAG: MarR family transcriptional regulator [Planctomycetota bacterium]
MSVKPVSPRAAVADRLHSAAIHLLRRVRAPDKQSGISPARLSALSVLVFAGARTLSQLAAAEQVRPPTMSVIVRALEDDGLVARQPSKEDARAVILRATAKGKRAMDKARQRRLALLEELLADCTRGEVATLDRAAELIEQASRRA